MPDKEEKTICSEIKVNLEAVKQPFQIWREKFLLFILSKKMCAGTKLETNTAKTCQPDLNQQLNHPNWAILRCASTVIFHYANWHRWPAIQCAELMTVLIDVMTSAHVLGEHWLVPIQNSSHVVHSFHHTQMPSYCTCEALRYTCE